MRRESLLKKDQATPPTTGGILRSTKVKREIDKQKRELKLLTPSDKMLVALRKVLTKLSNEDENGSRYYVSGPQLSITEQPRDQVVKEGEFASYHGAGYAKLGVTLKNGQMNYRYISFSISFRDCLNENGLPDVEYFDPTEVEDVGLHHPEVAGL